MIAVHRARLPSAVIGLALLGAGLHACSTVPGTGRTRVNLISSEQMSHLGRASFEDILARRDVVPDGPEARRVRRIGNDVVASARRLHPGARLPVDWDIVVIRDERANAFAVPGGRIGMHTGMITLAGNDAAIAVVLSHEVAHVLAQHAGERLSQGVLVVGGLAVASLALEDQDEASRRRIMAGLGLGATVGVMLPYSRLHESEADELGLMIAAEAGYDPREAIGLWTRMAREGGRRVEFLSTHPAPQTRIDRLRLLMPEAVARWRTSMRGPAR